MIEDKNGFAYLDGQRLFSVTPDEIIWRMRDVWLTDIKRGHNIMLEVILPYLEREAMSRFEKEWVIQNGPLPDLLAERDGNRMWWLNEASHNCTVHSPVGLAGDHLSAIGQTAVNILMASSALRDALAANKSQEAAALSMLLICEAMAGGYSIELESAKSTADAIKAAQRQAYESGAGKGHQSLQLARRASIDFAKKTWQKQPEMRIGEMADEILQRLKEHKDKFPSLESFPKVETIKTWLRDAGADKSLKIPEAAQKRGRSKKN